MGKVRRQFTVGFKQQVVDEIESGMLSKTRAARQYAVSASVIDRWVMKARAGQLFAQPSTEEKAVRVENERLKAKVGELTMLVDALKKMEAYAQSRRSASLSVVTAQTLAVLRGGAK